MGTKPTAPLQPASGWREGRLGESRLPQGLCHAERRATVLQGDEEGRPRDSVRIVRHGVLLGASSAQRRDGCGPRAAPAGGARGLLRAQHFSVLGVCVRQVNVSKWRWTRAPVAQDALGAWTPCMYFIAHYRQAVDRPRAQPVGLLIRGARPDLAGFDGTLSSARQAYPRELVRAGQRNLLAATRMSANRADPYDRLLSHNCTPGAGWPRR